MILRGELTSRYDPYFYSLHFVNNLKLIRKSVYQIVKFRTIIAEFAGGPMGFHLHTYDYREIGIPLLRIGNLKENYLSKDDEFIFISEEKHHELKNSRVNEGEIIFSKAGKVGEISIVPNGFGQANLNQALSRIKIIEGNSVEYITLFLKSDLGKLQIKRFGGGRAVQDDLKMSEIEDFLIILPPLHIQQQIVAKFKAAYAIKREKEAEAARLLESIDGYLFDKLDITVAEIPVKRKTFLVCSDKVSGGRLDPNAYNSERLLAIKAIKESEFPIHKLKNLVFSTKNIVTESENLPYIGLENIESNTGRYIEKNERDSFSSAVKFSKGQILFPKLRPYLNKVYLADFDGVCSTEFHVFDCKNKELTNEYLSMFLRSQIVLLQTKYLMSGNTLPRLQTEDIENLLIPLPPLSIQTELALKIEILRAEAQKLESEVKAEIEAAKKEVEAMILGKENNHEN